VVPPSLLSGGSAGGEPVWGARRLALTQPTLGRHVSELEEKLALSLFTRSPSGLEPTAAARRLAPAARAMAAAAEDLRRLADAARGTGGLAGTVRITATESMGAEVLPACLAPIFRTHPELVLELVLSNRVEDILRREADIAARMARPTQAALLARKIGTVRLGLFAHRSYVAFRGVPTTLEQLREHVVIGFDRDVSRGGTAGRGPSLDRSAFGFRTDHLVAQQAAIRAGVGIGAMMEQMAADDAELVRVLEGELSIPLELWLCMHEDQTRSPPVRYVFDELARSLAAWLLTARAFETELGNAVTELVLGDRRGRVRP